MVFATFLLACAAATHAQSGEQTAKSSSATPVPSSVGTSFRSGAVNLPAFFQGHSDGQLRAIVINVDEGPIRRNLALATVLAKQGIATFWFNYSGIYGSAGAYTFSNGLADTLAAVDYLTGAEARQRFKLGDAPIVIFGYSRGSGIAAVAASDTRVAALVALAPCDSGHFGRELANPQTLLKPLFDLVADETFGPKGPVPGGWQAFSSDLIANHQRFGFSATVSALQSKPVLVFAALDDEYCPLEDHFLPSYRALRVAKAPKLSAHVLSSGHDFDPKILATVRQMTADWIVQSVAATSTK